MLASPLLRRLAATQLACASLVMVSLTFTSACSLLKHPPKVFTPLPVAARVPPQPVAIPDVGTPPEFDAEIYPDPKIIAAAVELPPIPPPPAAVKPPATAKPPATVTVEVITPPVVAPKPAAIIRPADRQAFTKELDDISGRVKGLLTRVEGRTLSSDLQALVTQARNFLNQAEQARSQDLGTAVNYARRADSLAAELQDRLRP
ncbi:MAG: hypothetical protein ABI995_08780 [Acidobacteriota bacterium]